MNDKIVAGSGLFEKSGCKNKENMFMYFSFSSAEKGALKLLLFCKNINQSIILTNPIR